MAPKKTAKGPTPVDALKHSDKRTNIPTADAHDFVRPEIEQVRKIRLERDQSLDPQLVWKGKYDADGAGEDLIADAPPIYIQEKIDPRVLIENLRRTAERPDDEPELTLFDSFDGLDELDQVDFYQHDANWSNRMILGDSLQVMASLAEREKLRGKAQMIYVDPPYGIKFGSNWQVSARKRDVKDGKLEDAAREAEQIKAFRDTWELGIHSYLSYLRDRLLLARELLTESGSCFVQIGDENVHLVRSLMDEVFGSENFVSQIAFTTTAGATSEFLPSVANFLVWYGKDRTLTKFRPCYLTKGGTVGTGEYRQVELPDGSRTTLSATGDLSSGARLFRFDNL
ncbi:MAG: DNA methyltransferase, partial [Pseudonocardiaceae bacterium]